MASKMLSLLRLIAAISVLFLNYELTTSDSSPPLPAFTFSWLNNNDTFMAGEIATIQVRVLGDYEFGKYEFDFKPNVSVNDKLGNSSLVTGMFFNLDGNSTQDWSIGFVPIVAGRFDVLIVDQHFRVFDASLHFYVNPGSIYPAGGIPCWRDGVDEFTAGMKVSLLILPKDAFGNNVTESNQNGMIVHNYTLFASTSDGFHGTMLNVTNTAWNAQGCLDLEFTITTAGFFMLNVEVENQTLNGSPLPFKVKPGELDVRSCVVELQVETRNFQLFSMMEGFLHQHDLYGNQVPGFYDFDIVVLEKRSNLSIPVPDLHLKEASAGIQSFSFSLNEPGDFMLMIFDQEKRALISGMPFEFSVFIGYCDGETSMVNGTGLADSVAGEIAKFSVFLKDAYLYPSPIKLESLQIQIMHESGSVINSIIQVREADNGMNLVFPCMLNVSYRSTQPATGSYSYGRFDHGSNDLTILAPAPATDAMNMFTGNRSGRASDFDVVYVPEKSGEYEIRASCGNIPLNGGHPFRKKVTPGFVNISLSGVLKFAPKVSKLMKDEISVRLLDSHSNAVLKQQEKLRLEIASINRSAFSASHFSDNGDGTYIATYVVKDVGTYEMCVTYNGQRFVQCPFGVNVYNSEYFPKVSNDTISVWEDESIAFNVLENDYFADGNATILEYSKPVHGSLLFSGSMFRYTPYDRFYGKDWFSYTISDVNGNMDSGHVNLLIICRPPQLVSIPSNLQAIEDAVSPKFSGFSGFQLIYSDPEENISVTLSSPSGTLLLFPLQVQFWQPKWNELSVQKNARAITLIGSLDAINYAMQSVQYLGNENFYGDDRITVSAMNQNGRNDVDIPIYVQPINDHPIISIPSFVILKDMGEGGIIFSEERKDFDFIQDPDLLHFPSSRSNFSIILAVEVSAGLLSTSLPAELIKTSEVKLKNSYQWQPVQTFVTISRHFTVRAKGIRFQGSIDDCNAAMRQLSYHVGKHGAVLNVKVTDLGNHGCYPDCSEMMTDSLVAESRVTLIQHKPMSSSVAHTLGSIIVVESILVFSLGSLLLFFMCKCAFVLVHEKREKTSKEIELSKHQQSSQANENAAGPSFKAELKFSEVYKISR